MTTAQSARKHPQDAPLAIFLPSLAGGGAERIAINLASGFAVRGHKVDIVLARAGGEYLNRVPSDVRVVDLGATRPLTAIPSLIRYLRVERPRAMLATITNANLAALGAVQLSNIAMRCVVREASTLSVELAQSSVFNRILVRRWVSWSFRQAHAIVVPSCAAADDLASITGLPRDLIRVIYNPVVSNDMSVKARETVDHPWLQHSDIPVVIGIGRLTKQKDFETLIRAFARLKARIPSKLIILGEGEDRAALADLCRSLRLSEDVDLKGFVVNPYAYLSRSALFVLSSRWEGLPGVLIEALACGVRVVATDCQSGPREILQDGKFGQIVPVGDVMGMALAMERALAGEFVAEEPSGCLDLFDMESNTERYLALLDGEDGKK